MAITDKLTDTFNSTNPNVARVTSSRTAGATTLNCDSLAGWPVSATGPVHFSTYKIDTNNNVVAGTQIDWKGEVSGSSIGNLTRQAGATDSGNDIGDVVEMNPTGSWGHDLYTWGKQEHNVSDGTHKAITATSVTSTGDITAPQGNLKEGTIALTTVRSETSYDFVASGCVWSGDSYGSTRNASMTAGVVYIGGKRVVVALVTARSFTASKDTYIDVDNTGTITYTEVANNSASPALASNSIRIGIIITGAGNIANAGSVNQGQQGKLLPIASSQPYETTDSLGNLICPRDPSRRVLGLRTITSNANSSGTSHTAITGLSVPFIPPNLRKYKATLQSSNLVSGSANQPNISIWSGTVGSGTQIGGASGVNVSGTGVNVTAVGYGEGTGSLVTLNAGVQQPTSGTATVGANSTTPVVLIIEQE